MTIRVIANLLAGTAMTVVCPTAFAQTDGPADVPATAPTAVAASVDIATLIKELDANRFSKRQDASRALKKLGQPAIAALTKAALGTSREASSRAFEILKEHFAGGDGALKDAAKAALRKIADSDKTPLARNAKEILAPKPPPQRPQQMVPFGPAQIQVQFRMGGPQRFQARNVNGVKDIDIKEQSRTIKIHDDPNKGITVEITKKKNGKDVKQKFAAKDAAELKKKHPEAYKLYDKYGKGAPPVPLAIQGLQLPNIQIQQIQGGMQIPGRRLIDAKAVAEQRKRISAQVEETRKLLEKFKSNSQQTESLDKAIDQLKKVHEELKKNF